MLVTVPMSKSLPRMVRAGTPMASEKVRTVQGISRTTLSFRGAAVFVPVRLMCVFFRVIAGVGVSSSSSS